MQLFRDRERWRQTQQREEDRRFFRRAICWAPTRPSSTTIGTQPCAAPRSADGKWRLPCCWEPPWCWGAKRMAASSPCATVAPIAAFHCPADGSTAAQSLASITDGSSSRSRVSAWRSLPSPARTPIPAASMPPHSPAGRRMDTPGSTCPSPAAAVYVWRPGTLYPPFRNCRSSASGIAARIWLRTCPAMWTTASSA